MSESYHEKLQRVRRPRVHITYKVWTDGAEVERELPFVVGVVGDLSGNPTSPLKPIAERKFIEIDRDNFDDVLGRMTPGLNLKVADKLSGEEGKEMAVQLKFSSMADFDPINIAKQIPALANLLESREKLKQILAKADISPELEGVLEGILSDSDKLDKLKQELESVSGGKSEE